MIVITITFDPATNAVNVNSEALGNTMLMYGMLAMAKGAIADFARNQISQSGLIAPNGTPAVIGPARILELMKDSAPKQPEAETLEEEQRRADQRAEIDIASDGVPA